MKKRNSNYIFLLAVFIALGMASCKPAETETEDDTNTGVQAGVEEDDENAEFVNSSDFAIEISNKYAGNQNFEYLPAIPPVERDHQFQYLMEFNPLDLGFERISELIDVYIDPDFTISIIPGWDPVEREDGAYDLFIKPGRNPSLAIWNEIYETMFTTGETLSNKPDDEYYLDFLGEYNDWGNMPRYYLVQYVDMQTGEKLDKPLVQVFEVQAELPAPNVKFFINEKGLASLSWEPVEGAERYIVIKVDLTDKGEYKSINFNMAYAIDVLDATKTEWSTNNNLNFITAENFFERGGFLHEWEELNEEGIVENSGSLSIGVVALGAGGHSSVGKLFNSREFANMLPYRIAYKTKWEEGNTSITLDSVSMLPTSIPVVMCDGKIINKTIVYDYDRAKVVEETWTEYDEGPNGEILNPRPLHVTVLKVNWSLPSTPEKGYYNIVDPPANWREELKKIKDRQNELMRGSGTGTEIEIMDKKLAGGMEKAGEISVSKEEVFATNALSEYLAVCMLSGVPAIPLDPFPICSDVEQLLDAFFEAYYQNPLILGVDGLGLTENNELVVYYQEDNKTRKVKQAAIREKVTEITAAIIKDDMTPREKEFAINEYLCENSEYDFAALENAMENDFIYVDPSFNDSFTPYGILVNGVGVCASYAGSFKLLAEAAGLEAIVTTGKLEGLVNHAWNRIKLGDEWVSIDVTNNSNPDFYNALLNLPDSAASMVLIEDKDYMLDKYLPDYVSLSDEDEFYRVEENYYDKSTIAKKLVEGLKSNSLVTLRTDYDLDDEAFMEIALEVADSLGSKNLYGGYWFGVITLGWAA